VPFWALPLEQRPYFMQVVIPYQNGDWANLKSIASQWAKQEPASADAWYFLGLAEEGLQQYAEAEQDLKHAYDLNQRDYDAMLALSRVAVTQKDLRTLESIQPAISAVDKDQGEQITQQILKLKQGS
jgi:serine protease Do